MYMYAYEYVYIYIFCVLCIYVYVCMCMCMCMCVSDAVIITLYHNMVIYHTILEYIISYHLYEKSGDICDMIYWVKINYNELVISQYVLWTFIIARILF